MSRFSNSLLPIAAVLIAGGAAHGAIFKVPHTFQGGTDGQASYAAPIKDSAGNLYGTTTFGGNGTGCPVADHGGCGTVYKITPDGTKSVLHVFKGGEDGRFPQSSLVMDADGNLYGTTRYGGGTGCEIGGGCGTVFKLAPNGAETIQHVFHPDGSDGIEPVAGLVADAAGNLYGAALGGGPAHAGVIFKIAADNTYTILHTFSGTMEEQGNPNSLIIDARGNLYGTAGTDSAPTYCEGFCGTVFELAAHGTFRTLYDFSGEADGEIPFGAMVRDRAGNLYGTTIMGGTALCSGQGCGTVFKLAPNGTLTTLHSFAPGTDGHRPIGALAMDKAGNLYGTTALGGSSGCHGDGCGTIFEVAPDMTETVLHAFAKKQGSFPRSGLMKDKAGNLYGAASYGYGTAIDGTVFRLKP